MAELKVAQLRPPNAEALAQCFERWAQEARDGNCIGYSMIAIRPNGVYTCHGWQAKNVNALEEMGIHMTCLLDIWKDMHKERF